MEEPAARKMWQPSARNWMCSAGSGRGRAADRSRAGVVLRGGSAKTAAVCVRSWGSSVGQMAAGWAAARASVVVAARVCASSAGALPAPLRPGPAMTTWTAAPVSAVPKPTGVSAARRGRSRPRPLCALDRQAVMICRLDAAPMLTAAAASSVRAAPVSAQPIRRRVPGRASTRSPMPPTVASGGRPAPALEGHEAQHA